MSDRQKQIEYLEARGNAAEMLGALAYDPLVRVHNRRVADDLRAQAESLRREMQSGVRLPA